MPKILTKNLLNDILSDGLWIKNNFFSVFYFESRVPKVLFIINGKVGKSVCRNYLKRQLRSYLIDKLKPNIGIIIKIHNNEFVRTILKNNNFSICVFKDELLILIEIMQLN